MFPTVKTIVSMSMYVYDSFTSTKFPTVKTSLPKVDAMFFSSVDMNHLHQLEFITHKVVVRHVIYHALSF